MIAELVAINAAYGVIKEVVGNGRELYDCGAQLTAFFDNKATLQRKVNAAPPDRRGQIEEFFALEKIKEQEEELRQLMQWTGRPGLWDDWSCSQGRSSKN
jgi:ATP phosphoribosyltransferase regulatory subunit HisZ